MGGTPSSIQANKHISSTYVNNESEYPPTCDQCTHAQKNTGASWFCPICSENLCNECNDAHGRKNTKQDHLVRSLRPQPSTGDVGDQVGGRRMKHGEVSGKRDNGTSDISSGEVSGQIKHGEVSGKRDNIISDISSGEVSGQIKHGEVSGKRDNDISDISSGEVSGKHQSPGSAPGSSQSQASGPHQSMHSGANNIHMFSQATLKHQFDSAHKDKSGINDDTVAVTAGGIGSVVIFSVNDTSMLEIRRILTPSACNGICYNNGLIYVLIRQMFTSEVGVYTVDGTLQKKFELLANGQRIFQAPCFMKINHATETLYIADFTTAMVAGLTLDGTYLFGHTSPKCKTLQGIAIDNKGQVYVCGVLSNNVIRMTPDGSTSDVLLSKGVKLPQCVYVEDDELFLCCQQSSKVKIYKLS